MPFENLSTVHYTTVQKTAALEAITALEAALAANFKNLTAEERKKYGSINEQNKLIVNKVNDYLVNQPQLASSEVEWEEFRKDFSSRANLEALIARLDNLSTKIKNAKILHDYDNYQAALTDYAYTAYKAGTSAPGYETKQNDLKQFFANRGSSTTPLSI